MRNPERIDEFLDFLKENWIKYPDLRFGQIIIGSFQRFTEVLNEDLHSAIFYREDDRVLELLRKYFSYLDECNKS